MSNKADYSIKLRNFFIFSSQYGPKEGEEFKKILYYYPITDNIDIQIKNVGLVEGIIQFTGTFKPSNSISALHTQKTRQLYFQPENNFWMVITLEIPTVNKSKDGSNQLEYLEDDVQDCVYESILQQAYYMYRLFWGTFEQTIDAEDVGALKTKLEHFYLPYLKSLKLNHSDIINVFSGIQYLPLDKLTFLKVQCFVNSMECNYPEILNTAFLYNDHLIWSGVEPHDMKIIYQYLIGKLLPANVETELQGGSMPRNSASPFAAFHQCRFITGPKNVKIVKSISKLPKIYLHINEKPVLINMIVYRALSASVCLFIKADTEVKLDFFKELDEYLSSKLTMLVSDIAEYCSQQVMTPSNNTENTPKFIYFNKLNLAYKSTVHLDNKQAGNISCPKDSLKIMADMNSKKQILGHSGEIIVKTTNDNWVALKTSNLREFYIALPNKNSNLIDISEEIKKLCDTELKGIFFHPI